MSPDVVRACGLVVLAVAVLVVGPPPGGRRLADLAAPATGPAAPDPPIRPAWIAIAGLAGAAVGWVAAGAAAAAVVGTAAVTAAVGVVRRASREPADSEIDLSGCWELLAVCLRAGMPVAAAVTAAAESLDGPAGARLRRVAGLLALGADPSNAWQTVAAVPSLAVFARAAARSAGTGAGLAEVAAAEAARLRAAVADTAAGRAQRAGVLITGPLGLCFLPAFLVLGIGPVVIGLAGAVLTQW
ncbi:type II secretion system protein F (GspF) [Pseudonocardia thermophila]|uniref:Type II secretion system protein F (GspF) n=1 Tax=Pseudonocardia thermophila TaxID=1848 RepID=A0A1M6SDW7_PSETH|nr:type II secretion system F family protein [Pseudonocardia thermophila]SHK42865.1 type II secretion system protein F (GspF) [Pseudonocardia thermophila]